MTHLIPLILRYFITKNQDQMVTAATALAILAITISTASLLIIGSITGGVEQTFINRIIGITAPIQVERLGEIPPSDRHPELVSVSHPDIQATAPYLSREAILNINGNLVFIGIAGINLKEEAKVTKLQNYIKTPTPKLNESNLIIGKELAEKYNLKIGDALTLTNPQLNSKITLKISAIFHTGLYITDLGLGFINLKTAQTFYQTDRVTGYKVLPKGSPKNITTLKLHLKKTLGPLYEVATWKDLNANLLSALALERKVMAIILSILITIATLNIMATLLLKVLAHAKEWGILAALGYTPQERVFLIIGQAVLITTIGTLLGIVLGLLIATNINEISTALETLLGATPFPESLYFMEEIPVTLTPKFILKIISLSGAVALIAGLYPAIRTIKQHPIESIQHG